MQLFRGTHIANVHTVDEQSFVSLNEHIVSSPQLDFDKAVSHLPETERDRFKSLLSEFSDMFTGLGRTNLVEHSIPTGSARPVSQHYRRTPVHLKDKVKTQLDGLLGQGILEPVSDSQWANPLVLVKKSNGDIQICGDFRRLNAVTIPSVQVIPQIEDCLNRLAGVKWVTTVDLNQAYHQIPIKRSDRDKTTITTEFGLRRYTTAPYGLMGIPRTFNRALTMALSGISPNVCIQHFDDILVLVKDLSEMHDNLRDVLSHLQAAGFMVTLDKLHLCQREVKFLGYIVSAEGIACDPAKTQLIKDWPTPTSVEEVRAFLGLCSYLRKYMQDFASLTKPLTRLTEKSVPFLWTPEADASFQTMKAKLTAPPILARPRLEVDAPQFVCDTDASGTGLGACLLQDGKVLAYARRALAKSEKQYSATKRELLAVV